jgi:PEP-CTERM motif
MLRKGSLLICLLALVSASSASAVSTALISVNGGGYVSVPVESLGAEDHYCAGPAASGCPNGTITGAGYSIEVDVLLTPYLETGFGIAPNIEWSFNVTNDTGAALSLSFIFAQDIDAIEAAGLVNTSYRLGTTNAYGDAPGPVTATALAPPGGVPVDGDAVTEVQVFNLSSNGGSTLANAGIDLGPSFTSNPALTSDTQTAFNTPEVPGPLGSGAYNFMRVDVNLSTSAGGDIVNAHGTARVVPEPQTAALLGLGLLGIVYAGRRRA